MRSKIKKKKIVSSDRFENTDSDNWLTCRLRITQVSFFILHIRLGLFWHGDREREREVLQPPKQIMIGTPTLLRSM